MRHLFDLLLKTVSGFLSNLWHWRRWSSYRSAKKANAPIFIVGCGHSGTSLLLAILGAHSRIHAIPDETSFAYDHIGDRPRLIKGARFLLWYFDSKAIKAGKPRWVEKTPKHIHAIPTLLQLRPDAKIIIVIRDGRDVAISLSRRDKDLKHGIGRWVADNRAGEPYWDYPNVLRIRYEDLVEDFAGTMRTVLHFLGEDFEAQLARYYENQNLFYFDRIERPSDARGDNHGAYRTWQINQPLFDGRGRWKALKDDEKPIIKQAAGAMLVRYGYAENEDW